MENWWYTALPIILGGLGYLARRWIERRRRSEALKRKLQALALHQGMARAGVNLQDLDRIEREAGCGLAAKGINEPGNCRRDGCGQAGADRRS